MGYFLGVDVGGTKTHALLSEENGRVVGFATGGPGNWEGIGYDGLTRVLQEVLGKVTEAAGINVKDIVGAGMGIGGYDWPSQHQAHMDAIRPIGLNCPLEIVNDATLGLLAGASEGWGISVVSGTGCNCRGWSKDLKHEGRVVGGADWSGEAAGGYDILVRAMQAVTYEWDQRGPATALTGEFIQATGAENLGDLIEGLYTWKYRLEQVDVKTIFKVAARGDRVALAVVRWAGEQLGDMACGVIRQLGLEKEYFDVVLIGSLFDGHPLMSETLMETVQKIAPGAQPVRLTVPPVVGGVILGMQKAGLDARPWRPKLVSTIKPFLGDVKVNSPSP